MSNSKFDINYKIEEQLQQHLTEEIKKLFINCKDEQPYSLMLRVIEKIDAYKLLFS